MFAIFTLYKKYIDIRIIDGNIISDYISGSLKWVNCVCVYSYMDFTKSNFILTNSSLGYNKSEKTVYITIIAYLLLPEQYRKANRQIYKWELIKEQPHGT